MSQHPVHYFLIPSLPLLSSFGVMLCSLGYLRFSVQPQQAGDSGLLSTLSQYWTMMALVYWEELEELSIIFST